jgi:hypothetical protein
VADADTGSAGVSTADALEAILSRVTGIRAARVVPDGERISEIHVISDSARSPKQLVRDIQSAAKASLDLEIDYRTVSIVQMDDQPATAATSSLDEVGTDRVKLAKVVAEATGRLLAVRVELSVGASTQTGSARGSSEEGPLLVARATLEAFSSRLGDSVAEALATDIVEFDGRSIAVSVVRLVTEESVREIAGAAIVGTERNDAFARATLDAVNRIRP